MGRAASDAVANDRVAEPGESRPTALEVCERHGGATYSLARLLTTDDDEAVAVAAQAIVDASHSSDDGVDQGWLARHVYVLNTRGRSGRGDRPGADDPRGLSREQASALGLALFGRHTYREVADLMGVSLEESAELMRSGLRALARQHGPGPGGAPSTSSSARPDPPGATRGH